MGCRVVQYARLSGIACAILYSMTDEVQMALEAHSTYNTSNGAASHIVALSLSLTRKTLTVVSS